MAAFQSFYFMMSRGSFSFGGNVNALPSACERERMSLFKPSCSPLCRCRCRAAVRPLACCLLPAEQPGCPAFTACLKWGSDAGSGRSWVEREGKYHPRPGDTEKRKPSSCLPPNSIETHSPCLSPALLPCPWVETVPPASPLPRLPADLPGRSRRTAGAHPRANANGVLRAQRRRCPSSRGQGSFRGGRIPSQAVAQRVPAPTPRFSPKQFHLQTHTPDECLKITMLPCLPLAFWLMHVGGQPMRRSATLPAGPHWLEGLTGAGSGPHRLSSLVSWLAGVPTLLTLPALQQRLFFFFFCMDKGALDKFMTGELDSRRRLRNRKKLGS